MALKAYYKMNTGFNDFSGNDYHGTPVGVTIDDVNQKLGAGCGVGDGLNDKVTFSSFWDPSGATELSIDGWVKAPDPLPNGNYGIFGWWEAPSKGFILYCTGAAFDKLYVVFTPSIYGLVNDVDLYTDWTHIAAVYNGNLADNENRLKIYINGVQKSVGFTGTIPAAITTVTIKPEMFSLPVLNYYWKDTIDDLAIYDHALTQAEIDDRYNSGAGKEISLVTGFPFFFRIDE